MIDTIADLVEVEVEPPGAELLALDEGRDCTDAGTMLIVEYAATKNEEAFKNLVLLYHARGVNLLRGLGIYEDHLEDLMQETWLKVADRSWQFEQDRAFGPWFNRIALNTARDFLRKWKRHPPHLLPSQVGEDGGDNVLDRAVEARHPCVDVLRRLVVHEVLGDMPKPYGEVLWEKYGLDTSTEELARRAGRTDVTIRWQMGQARQKFQDLWGEEK